LTAGVAPVFSCMHAGLSRLARFVCSLWHDGAPLVLGALPLGVVPRVALVYVDSPSGGCGFCFVLPLGSSGVRGRARGLPLVLHGDYGVPLWGGDV